MDPLTGLVRPLVASRVRFLISGVAGANYYARAAGMVFTTEDRDLFLPPDADNLVRAWAACEAAGLSLWVGNEPLDMPRDDQLARAVIDRRAGTTALGEQELQVDLTLVMAGFNFEEVWPRRRTFVVDGVPIPVALLTDIVQSKANVGRPKDRLFLATHEDAIRQLLGPSPLAES